MTKKLFSLLVYSILVLSILLMDKIYLYFVQKQVAIFIGNYYESIISNYVFNNSFNIKIVLISAVLIKLIYKYIQNKQKNKIVYRQNKISDLYKLNWQEFEYLLERIFVMQGYKIKPRGGAHADGGVDLEAYKHGKKIIVQCKQWKKSKVGVSIVREMFGVMIHEKAKKVYIVTCGGFTKDAKDFAIGKPIELLNGYKLIQLIEKIK